jgi:hypothetical protein
MTPATTTPLPVYLLLGLSGVFFNERHGIEVCGTPFIGSAGSGFISRLIFCCCRITEQLCALPF